ncbi:MAG TPA: hypothetical protein VHU19_14075 [Pyrinomonadaceae bacterium]|jgi:hypothetical protein|nr:hypothetical protein [Pyrinomonadaceae bacterium]
MTQKKSIRKGGREGKAEGSKRPKTEPLVLNYEPLGDKTFFEGYRGDGEFFAAILSEPACPQTFRDLFGAVFFDEMMNRAGYLLSSPLLLPIIYPIVRDILDENGFGGTAEGLHEALIQAVEVLVPEETANRVREKLGLVNKK